MRETEKILDFLPSDIRRAVEALGNGAESLCEIRLRCGGALSVWDRTSGCFLGKYGKVNSPRDALSVSKAHIDETLRRLCAGSVYSFEDCIRTGYIPTDLGRVGVCANVKTRADGSLAVGRISSLVLRIPHRAEGAAKALMAEYDRRGLCGALVFSPPGGGKTTVLREAAEVLSQRGLKVAVADERCELEILGALSQCQVYSGYPKAVAVELATRTVSPQLLVCDEIGGEKEAAAILSAQSTGVPLLASAHAGTKSELYRRPHIKKLIDVGIFSFLYDCRREEAVSL